MVSFPTSPEIRAARDGGEDSVVCCVSGCSMPNRCLRAASTVNVRHLATANHLDTVYERLRPVQIFEAWKTSVYVGACFGGRLALCFDTCAERGVTLPRAATAARLDPLPGFVGDLVGSSRLGVEGAEARRTEDRADLMDGEGDARAPGVAALLGEDDPTLPSSAAPTTIVVDDTAGGGEPAALGSRGESGGTAGVTGDPPALPLL